MSQPDLIEDHDVDRVQRVYLSHFLKHTSSPCLETFPASFIEPYAYWSHAEKASFFKSLARHSRWKPDLIAEDIGGGKNVADICSYISLLEQASARESRKRHKRDAYPIAYDISEEWIAVENGAADELCGKDTEWQEAALRHRRTQELKELKNSLRNGSETGYPGDDDVLTWSQIIKRSRLPSNEENEAWEERFKVRKRELADQWEREKILSSLDGRYLKTMDKMLGTLESTKEDNAMEGGGQLGHEDLARDRGAQLGVSMSSNFAHDVATDRFSGLMSSGNDISLQIDPVLLAIDRTVANARTLSVHFSDKHHGPVGSSSQNSKSAVPLPSRAQSPVPPPSRPSPNVTPEIPRDVSPASRRRLRKRLWTRRKRAMESGLPVSEVPMDTGKLKRGRKAKRKPLCEEGDKAREDDSETQVEVDHPRAPEVSSHPPASQGPMMNKVGDENEGSDSCPKRKPYGWSKLIARQVSGETLRADGMDLFHLEKFVNIMSLLGRVHSLANGAGSIDKLEDVYQGPSALSYPLLRFLHACIVRFVTRLVAYTILHKDFEFRQKRRIRGIFQTGGADKIRAENVREALLHLEKDPNTKQFFISLKRTLRKAVTVQAPFGRETVFEHHGTDDSNESDSVPGIAETEDDSTSSTGSYSTHFNRVSQNGFSPSGAGPQAASPLFWNPSVLSAFSGKDGDAILPDKMDEAELWKELRAEEKLEEADREAARMHERGLWVEIGVTKVDNKPVEILVQKPEGTEASRHLNTKRHSLRLRQPRGTVKSSVFINSDEDF